MANHIDGIDHVLVAVADLDKAAAGWERLGFTLTPRGGHPERGTANRCIMFERDYLELIGAVGPGSRAEQVRGFLAERGEAVLGLALATADGPAARRDLARAGVAAGEPRSLSRSLDAPGGAVTLMFSVLDLPSDTIPGAAAILCQHVTPELLRRPAWLGHANGAVGITSLTIAVADPESHRATLEAVFGPGTSTATDNTVAVHTGHGLLLLVRPDEVTQLHPDAALEDVATVPSVVALTLAVADSDQTVRALEERGVAFARDTDGTVRVAPEDASGVFLEFARLQPASVRPGIALAGV